MDGKTILKAEGIAKHFGSVVALKNVDFHLNEGEVVGIVGDNGAGKSTFIKILSGVHKKDKGKILIDNEDVEFNNPNDSINAGIETVYQDLSLAPQLNVYTNMFLGREILSNGLLGKLGFVNKKTMKDTVVKELKRLKITVKSVNQHVEFLSGGQRQSLAIARAVFWGKKILILDEPTAALGVEQSRMVLELIKKVKQDGVSVILISHTIPHVMEVCDRISVFRLGESITDLVTGETSIDEVVQWITGSKVRA